MPQQLWIVDASAANEDDLAFQPPLPSDALPAARPPRNYRQSIIRAARAGQAASNDPVRSTGLFSDVVLDLLADRHAVLPGLPDPQALYDAVKARFADLREAGRTRQHPRSCCGAPAAPRPAPALSSARPVSSPWTGCRGSAGLSADSRPLRPAVGDRHAGPAHRRRTASQPRTPPRCHEHRQQDHAASPGGVGRPLLTPWCPPMTIPHSRGHSARHWTTSWPWRATAGGRASCEVRHAVGSAVCECRRKCDGRVLFIGLPVAALATGMGR